MPLRFRSAGGKSDAFSAEKPPDQAWPAAAAHLLGQSLRQDLNRLRFGVRFGQDRLGLT